MSGTGPAFELFVGYASRDHQAVVSLVEALEKQEGLKSFVDRYYLVPGRPWPQALERALASSGAVAVCIGPGELGRWQQREMNWALDRQTRQPKLPVIPVLLPGADLESLPGFLAQNTWVDLRGGVADPGRVAILAGAARGRPPGLDATARFQEVRDAVCPYRGLLYFREEDETFFCGRQGRVNALVELVERSSFSVVVGASGSGKSSLVRAGLVPRLRRSRDLVWEVATMVPSDRPLHQLAAALVPLLEPALSEVDLLSETSKLERMLLSAEVSVRDVVDRLLARQKGTTRLLLVVDQWEELYTLAKQDDVRRRFVDELLGATTTCPLSVVATVRGDFMGHAVGYRPLADRLQGAQLNLGPMIREELRDAIVGPAKQVGLSFEGGLVERLLDDVGDEPGNLPLLEFVLRQLWAERRTGELQHESYDRMGCLKGAVAKRADKVLERLSPLERDAARRIFLQLARLGDGADFTRRRARRTHLPATSWDLVVNLARERLLVTTAEGEGVGAEEATVEVTHEALIAHWEQLRGWLSRDREFLLWRERLRPMLAVWEANQQGEGAVLRGPFLAEVSRWMKERAEDLTPPERNCITASEESQQRIEREERTRQEAELQKARELADQKTKLAEERGLSAARQRRFRNALAVIALVVAFGAVGLYRLWRASEAARDEAERTLGAVDLRDGTTLDREGRPAEALPHLASALGRLRGDPLASTALMRALTLVPRHQLRHEGAVWAASFSADGTRVVTASDDKTARIWNATTGEPVGAPLRHEGRVSAASFSADGTRVVTASEDGTARIWNATTGEPVGAPLRHEGPAWAASFSADGTRVVTAGEDGTARIWNATTGEPVGAPLHHEGTVRAASFSADGTRVVTASYDMTARIWNATTGEPVGAPFRHEGLVSAASFSADGTRVVTASEDKTARIWDIGVLPADATGVRLAVEASEVLSGYTLNEGRALMPIPQGERQRLAATLRERVKGAPSGKPTFPSFLRWLLDDPATRTISPYFTVTVPEFIRAQTKLCIPNARAEIERLYLGHPVLREPSDCKPPNSKETNARALDR